MENEEFNRRFNETSKFLDDLSDEHHLHLGTAIAIFVRALAGHGAACQFGAVRVVLEYLQEELPVRPPASVPPTLVN